jgi:hypothetical protein
MKNLVLDRLGATPNPAEGALGGLRHLVFAMSAATTSLLLVSSTGFS